jgi:hypothetical protein
VAPWSWVDKYKWNDMEEVAASIFRVEEFLHSALKLESSGSFETLLCVCQTTRHGIVKPIILVLHAVRTLDLACISISFRLVWNYFPSSIRDMVKQFYKLCHYSWITRCRCLEFGLFLSVGPTSLANLTGILQCVENCTFVLEFSVQWWILHALDLWILCILLAVCT